MPVYELAAKKKKRVAATRPNDTETDAAATESPAASAAAVCAAANGAAKPTAVDFSEPAQWVERMALTSTRALPADLNADDDPKREEAFIQQALLSVSRGLALLDSADVPCRRPADYYAEMYKSDVQMSRIAKAIDESRARIEEQAHRRAMKDQKKYGKEVQAEVLRQRAKYKRDMGERLSDWRRKRKGNDELRDILDGDDGEADGGKGPASKRHRAEKTQRPRNLRPGGGGGGGGAKKRPGKNARRRH